MIGEDKLLKFSGVAVGEACTIVIRGATSQIVEEAERSLHDALCVLAATVRETRTVYGGGMERILILIRMKILLLGDSNFTTLYQFQVAVKL